MKVVADNSFAVENLNWKPRKIWRICVEMDGIGNFKIKRFQKIALTGFILSFIFFIN